MAKYTGLGFLAFLFGAAIAALIINMWLTHKELDGGLKIIVTIISASFVLSSLLVKASYDKSVKREKERDKKEQEMDEKIKLKADNVDFTTFKNYIDCQMMLFRDTVKEHAGIIEEARANMELMVKNNAYHNNQILIEIKRMTKSKN